MEHWLDVLGDRILTVDYEALVTDLPKWSKLIIEHCELDWQAQCAEFYKNPSATTTASASQVRRAAYQSSIGKWRHFSTQLEPIAQQLEAAGINYRKY